MDLLYVSSGIAVGLGGIALYALVNWRKYRAKVLELEDREMERLWLERKAKVEAEASVKPKRKYTRKPKPASVAVPAESGAVLVNGAAGAVHTSDPAPEWPFPTNEQGREQA